MTRLLRETDVKFRIFVTMQAKIIIYRFLVVAAVVFFLTGCESLPRRDEKMEEISGKYTLSRVVLKGKNYSTASLVPSTLEAEIYEADGQWYFDATFPILNYHGVIDYHKLIFQMTWDQVLCKYLFYSFPEEQERLNIKMISFRDGVVSLSIAEPAYPDHYANYEWKK